MITRLSISFKDLLGSLIAPQVMPHRCVEIQTGSLRFKLTFREQILTLDDTSQFSSYCKILNQVFPTSCASRAKNSSARAQLFMSFRQRHIFPHNFLSQILFVQTFIQLNAFTIWCSFRFSYFLNATNPRRNQSYTALRHLSIMVLGWTLLQTPIMFLASLLVLSAYITKQN